MGLTKSKSNNVVKFIYWPCVNNIFFMFFILFKSKCITKVITNIVSFVLLVDDDIWVDVVFLKLQVYELTIIISIY